MSGPCPCLADPGFERRALAIPLFHARAGEVDVLANAMICARTPGRTCSLCGEAIPAGTRARIQTELDRGRREVRSSYACAACCAALARAAYDPKGARP